LLKNSGGNSVAEYWYDTGHDTNVTSGAFYWRQYSPNTTANTSTTGKYETYSLPTVATGLTENKTYTIITTKNLSSITTVGTITSGTWNGTAIAVDYGGTGATTAAGARTNLGLGSAAVQNTSYFVRNGGNHNLGSGSPATNSKAYYEASDGMTEYWPYLTYNTSGVEYTLLFTGRK
jgi:hypothetical protein